MNYLLKVEFTHFYRHRVIGDIDIRKLPLFIFAAGYARTGGHFLHVIRHLELALNETISKHFYIVTASFHFFVFISAFQRNIVDITKLSFRIAKRSEYFVFHE